MLTVLERDPFARLTWVRKLVPQDARKPCTWCGNRPGRFLYGVERDGVQSRLNWSNGRFCSRSCHDSYHNIH